MNYKHGGRRSALYGIWCGIKDRCGNPNSPAYANYGGRGITVCERWSTSFEAFRQDMGDRPAGMSIERTNNGLGYEPGNCVWATWSRQQRNKRSTRMLTIDGTALSAAEWSELSGIKLQTITRRLDLGWSSKDAVFQPLVTARKGVPRGQRLITAFGAERGVKWSGP